MDATKSLLKRLPKKEREKVWKLEEESDLIDDCKYMLWWTEKYTDGECYGSCFPVRSIAEAVEFVRESLHK